MLINCRLLARLPMNSRLLVVKFWGLSKVICGFLIARGLVAQTCILSKDKLSTISFFDLSSHLDSQCLQGRNQVQIVLGILNFIYQDTSGSK